MAGKRQSTEHKIGSCACGHPITLGDRYSVSTQGPTTVKRTCQGYGCTRVNEIVLSVRAEIKAANWAIHECLCGSKLYTRSEYAGPRFEGYDGASVRYPFGDAPESAYKNRTVKLPCRGCKCRYVIQIRFKKENGSRFRETNARVYRCGYCKMRKDQEGQNAGS